MLVGKTAFRLTEPTVAALEVTIEKCRTDGRTFTLGLFELDTDTMHEFAVTPSTPVQFSYAGERPSESESSPQAAKLLDGIILEGRVIVVIPSDE